MVEETSDLGAASIWIVDNCDIILNWWNRMSTIL
jgi:hypothetical protein